jgi:uncharacterized integral membrane protein
MTTFPVYLLGSAEVSNTPSLYASASLGALVALVLIVALQNSQEVQVDVLFLNMSAPLIVILLAAVAVGALIGYAAPVLRRHRRDERRRGSES